MNAPRPQPPYGVPTLTEVVEPLQVLQTARPVVPEDAEPASPPAAAPAESPVFDEAQLIERVLADLQRQVELMLEYRLREVLTPALMRATDALVKDARVELASTLRDVVARAVAQELLRHRGR